MKASNSPMLFRLHFGCRKEVSSLGEVPLATGVVSFFALSLLGLVPMELMAVQESARHGSLEGEKMLVFQNSDAFSAANFRGENEYKRSIFNAAQDRHSDRAFSKKVGPAETLKGFERAFDNNRAFRSEAEICSLPLVPDVATSSADSETAYWRSGRLTGDNFCERPYVNLLPRLTIRSNIFTVHLLVQSLRNAPNSPPAEWNEETDQITAEYQGSRTIERHITPDSNPTSDCAGFANLLTEELLDAFTGWRVIHNKSSGSDQFFQHQHTMKNTYKLDFNLGVKSYSFRHIKDNADVAAAVRSCGSTTIDLSRCHVAYDDPAAQEVTIETYRQAGVRITGIGVVLMTTDEKTNRQYFDFVRRAGCDLISCSFDPEGHEDTLRNVEALCGEYGVRVAIHNHGGKHWLGNSTILQYFFNRTSPSLGLCLDTAWCLQAGEDPLRWLELFGERLYGVHFKDFVCNPTGQFRDTILGEGMLDLPGFLQAFRELPFNGSAVVEYEGTNPVEATKRCVKVVRRVWQELDELRSVIA